MHVVHFACRVLGFMFLMTSSHQLTKSMTTSSYDCPICMTSLSHRSLVRFRSFSIAYYVDDY